jgi:hypothetical protein
MEDEQVCQVVGIDVAPTGDQVASFGKPVDYH